MFKERTRLLYVEPKAMIPKYRKYSPFDRKVTASGFIRSRPTLAQRLSAYLDDKAARCARVLGASQKDDSMSFGRQSSADRSLTKGDQSY